LFGFAYGLTGRFMLREDAIEPNYGLRVALNIAHPGDRSHPPRFLRVNAQRLSDNPMHTQRQVLRDETMEAFELDVAQELLQGIEVRPADQEAWGRRLRGGDPVG